LEARFERLLESLPRLHSSALAAQELGGSLSVHGDGPGRGAIFTLEIPYLPAQEEA
jgi:two-component system, NtrC family, sensor kinase